MNSAIVKNPIEKYFSTITPYHYYFFFLLFLSKVPVFWHVLGLIFLSPPVDFYCKEGDETTKNVCPCPEPIFDTSVFSKTIQSKYKIVCDDKWQLSLTQSSLYLGMLIGAFTFGFLSDRFGRLTMFCLGCLLLGIFGCIVIVMPTIAAYSFIRCLEGIGLGGAVVTSYVLCIEYCDTTHREVIAALYHVPINLSHISLPGVSYLLRDCDELQLAISVPMFLFVAMQWITYESPKWLMDNGNVDRAAAVMEKFARFNKTPIDNIKQEMQSYHDSQRKTVRLKMKFWQIFKYKRLTINFFCMAFNYFVCGVGYYGVSQYIGMMSGDIHLNVTISGLLLVPGTAAAVLLLKSLSRRTFLMITNFFSGVFMITVMAVPEEYNWVRVLFACICNCFFFMSFIIVFLYGVELFPTAIRNSVLGILSVLARAGQIVAPVINGSSPVVAGYIFGVSPIIAAFVCIPLPETKEMELPSSLEDSKTLPRRRSSVNPNVRLSMSKT